jgi:hypothetical protein
MQDAADSSFDKFHQEIRNHTTQKLLPEDTSSSLNETASILPFNGLRRQLALRDANSIHDTGIDVQMSKRNCPDLK